MPEQDYVEALSGEEIITDLCSQIAEWLRRDCNLRQNDGYQGGYSGTVKVKLSLYGMDEVAVEAEIPVTMGNHQGNVESLDAGLEIPLEPALNAVRERSDQPVPTMAATEQGAPEVRQRRYIKRDRVVIRP